MKYKKAWTYVDKLLAVSVLCSASLVLEDNIIVPATFHVEVLGVEQRVTARNIDLALLFLLCCPFTFLACVSRNAKPGCIKSNTSFSFCANRSFLIFSSSRINSAASSSSSLYFVRIIAQRKSSNSTHLSSSLLSSSDPSESASISRDSSNMRRRLASGSSSSTPPSVPSGTASSWRLGADSSMAGCSAGAPFFLAK